MRLSVVIPTYNSGPLVVQAVESVLSQTLSADEVIVVDDGSTDDTTDRLDRFGDRVRYIRKENGGVATARNLGIAEATGDLIAFLDADDVWHPRKLELQLTALAKHPELGMVGTTAYRWPEEDHPTEDYPPAILPVIIPFDGLVIKNRFITSTVVIRASVLREVGDFDVEQFGTEDYDLWLRVAQRFQVANLSVRLTGYRLDAPKSLSKNADRMEAGMRIILTKLENAGVFCGHPLFRRKAWAYARYSWGWMHAQAGHHRVAIIHMLLSLLGYPFPYPRSEVRNYLGRLRLLRAQILCGLRK